MNKRLNDLAEKAGWGQGHTWDDCMQCSPFDPEAYAQMVVAECLKVVEKEIQAQKKLKPASVHDQEWVNGKIAHFKKLKTLIREHFKEAK